MTLPVFHPCRFSFDTQDIRRVGSVVSGGTSLSGIDDPIEADGGGFWRADFSEGETIDRADTLAWRAITAAMDNGSAAVVVEFCDRLHQPVGGDMGVPSNRAIQFGDGRDYEEPGVAATAVSDVALRATSMDILIQSENPLLGGEKFTIVHTNWGERAYEVVTVSGSTITFRPPLREAILGGTALDFDNPRCKMRVAPGSNLSQAVQLGRYGQCAISFVEDMRKPGA